MAYLNVEPTPPALPSVWGLGRYGLGARIITPPMIRIRRSGLGQTGCPGTLTSEMQSWLNSLSAELPVDAAVGCGPSGGAPCSSPAEASQMAETIAQNFCSLAAEVAGQFDCTVDPACANPAAAAAPYAAQALSLFQSFPASVWSTESENAASGNYYGAIGTEQGPGVQTGCEPGGNGVYLATVNGAVVSIPCGTAAPSGSSPATAPAFTPQAPIQYGPPVSQAAQQTSQSGGQTSVTLENVSNPGQPFQAGDSFQLTISGPANAAVTGSASQNGIAPSTSNQGTTNPSGQLIIQGNFGAGDVGTWQETWTVAGASPTQLSFTVAAAGSGQNPAGQTPTTTSVPAPTSGIDLSFLSADVNLFGVSIPVWALGAAGLAALLLIPRR